MEQDARAVTITLKMALQDEKKTDIREESSKLTNHLKEIAQIQASLMVWVRQTREFLRNWKDLCMIRIKEW